MPYFVQPDHRLHYRERGSGLVLLLFPGNTASSACHDGELAFFGQFCHTVALDIWGTGRSDRWAPWPDE
jgi:pimeloyl-ACP methyl ester carboxylesterase